MRSVIFLLALLAGCDQRGGFQPVAVNRDGVDRIWLVDTASGRVAMCSAGPQLVACSRWAEPTR